MNTNTSLERVTYAYLLAVSCATVTFVSGNELWDFFTNGDAHIRFPLATLVLAWIMAFAASLPPFAVSIALAIRRGYGSARYFMGGAVATALAWLPFLACAYAPRHLLRLGPMLALAGLAAGGACWLVLKSAHDEDTVPAF
ncbi:hypothetical protein [Massilia eburnea]|uniref:hypothetical protein n=1 Tax=Massilia eburnea TaxID=1776165 RepID=UPI001E347802|nr:hypothetical protein [Massilia eburnea]